MRSSDSGLAKTLLCPSWNITVLRACCVLPVAVSLDSAGRVVRSWSTFGVSCSVASLIITTVSSIFICQNSSSTWYEKQPMFVNFLAQMTMVFFILSTIVSTLVFLLKRESWVRLFNHLLIADSLLVKWDQVQNHSSHIVIFHICTFIVNTMCFVLGFYEVEMNIIFSPAICANIMWGGLINDATQTMLLIILESISKRFQILNTVIHKYHPGFIWLDCKTGSSHQCQHLLPARKRKHLHVRIIIIINYE